VLSIATSIYLVSTRLNDLEAKAELESMVSREAAFLYNNLVLVGIAFSVLWGTLFPIVSEAVRGTKITVGPSFFNTVNVPLGLLLLLLTGIGPLIAWRRASVTNLKRQFQVPVAGGIIIGGLLFASGMRNFYALVSYTLVGFVAVTILQEFYKGVGARRTMYGESAMSAFFRLIGRNRRRYGGYIVHAGVVIIFAAFGGLAFKTEHDLRMNSGDVKALTDPWGHHWTFTNQGVSRYDVLNRDVTAVALDATRDGKRMGVITSEKRQYFSGEDPNTRVRTFEPSTEVGIMGSFSQDVYVTLAGVDEQEASELRITFNPLVRWVWLGGALMALGGLIVMWPQAERRRKQSGYVTTLRSETTTVAATL
jgi:cytochrome c-type biogenesis protein CcmF